MIGINSLKCYAPKHNILSKRCYFLFSFSAFPIFHNRSLYIHIMVYCTMYTYYNTYIEDTIVFVFSHARSMFFSTLLYILDSNEETNV